jgi:hypothetical protein
MVLEQQDNLKFENLTDAELFRPNPKHHRNGSAAQGFTPEAVKC